ncbi:MAG TPA: NAD-dependent epimerase/dehydratase family protein [Egibacteraceae bacterium]|nr:NAD-dependent epimerase/dehydratase family protein [Egibacteraceae bacterium]
MAERSRRRVLITGIAGVLASRLATRLAADDGVGYVAGVDLREPPEDLDGVEFIRADLRSPLVAKVVESTQVDTIVHLHVVATPRAAGGRARMKEHNIIGTMQLLGAAQRAPALRKVVVTSTTAVYGSSPNDPALFKESAAPDTGHPDGYGKDAVEVESYARAFGRRREDVTLTILRFAELVGPRVDTPLTRYLALPVVPTVLGYDPRLQLCHEDDAVAVLERAVHGDHHGTTNVAGSGIVYLSQAVRIAGRVPVPVTMPFAHGIASVVRRAQVDLGPEQLPLLMYGRVGDITRLRERFGYAPAYTTREALVDFLTRREVAPVLDPGRVARVERRLHALLARPAKETTP